MMEAQRKRSQLTYLCTQIDNILLIARPFIELTLNYIHCRFGAFFNFLREIIKCSTCFIASLLSAL